VRNTATFSLPPPRLPPSHLQTSVELAENSNYQVRSGPLTPAVTLNPKP